MALERAVRAGIKHLWKTYTLPSTESVAHDGTSDLHVLPLDSISGFKFAGILEAYADNPMLVVGSRGYNSSGNPQVRVINGASTNQNLNSITYHQLFVG